MAAPSITISILGRDYQIACPPEEEESLRKSGRYLDQQMEQLRNRSASLGYEKIAVLAALNITHEMLSQKIGGFDAGEIRRRMNSMQAMLDEALSKQDKLF